MKKIKLISLILALVMVIGLFAGCGKPGADGDEGDTTAAPIDNTNYKYGTIHGITWTFGGQADRANATEVQREEERNAEYFQDTGNTRQCVAFTYNYDTVGALFEGGQMPTVFPVQATEPARLVEAGWGRDISNCIETVGLDLSDFNQTILATYMDENGGVYGLPYFAYSMCLVVNGALYKEAGLVDENGEPVAPTTWEEVIEHANTIKEKTGKGGLALQCSDREGGWIFTNIAWNFGADLCVWDEEAGKFVSGINTPETIAALEWYKEACWSEGLAGTPSTDSRNSTQSMLKAGECAIIMGATDFADAMTGEMVDGMDPQDIYYFNMPAGPTGLQYNLMGGAGYWFSSSATDEEVIAVLEYLLNYGFWTQEWTEDGKAADYQDWEDRVAQNKLVLPSFPVYNAPYQAEREAEMLAAMADLYNYEAQFKTVFDFAQKEGTMHTEEECDVQNLYQQLTNILQEIATDPNADVAALAAQADASYTDLLNIAQGG